MAASRSVVLLDIGLALVFVVHVLLVIWLLRRSFRARASRSRVGDHADEEEGGRVGLSAEEVGELPCHELREEGAGGGECAVCLEAFRDGDQCRALPRCGHGFHPECVDSWLRKSRRCPICRAEVVAPGKYAGAVEEAAAPEIV
ncbi:hypothetical protein ACP70R_026280 [Stipagrostis hirtigluma subsp. patula]